MSKSIGGIILFRAAQYAFGACPKDDRSARMQHLVFVGDRIVGSDGERWHVGRLPPGCSVKKPMAVTRESVCELLLGLEYTRRMAKRSGHFETKIAGDLVTIKYGDKILEHRLDEIDVGDIPMLWTPPVSDDAPSLAGEQAEFRCGHVQDAMKWHKSWERDYGTVKTFGLGGNNPVRYDIVSGGDLVVQAYLLPVAHTPAQLPDDAPLLEKGKRRQSVLDLNLNPPPPSDLPEGAAEALPDGDKRKKKAKKQRAGEDETETGL